MTVASSLILASKVAVQIMEQIKGKKTFIQMHVFENAVDMNREKSRRPQKDLLREAK